MKQKDGWLRSITLHMEEVNPLAFNIGRKIGKLVDAPFDGAPVVAFKPVGNETPKVAYADPRLPPTYFRQLAPVISFNFRPDSS